MQTSIKNGFNKQLGQVKVDFAASFSPHIKKPSQSPQAAKEPLPPRIPHMNIAPAAGRYVESAGINQNQSEINYLTYLMSQMEKTDKGREILTTLSKSGYSVAIDYTTEFNGYCDINNKTLFVKPTDPNGQPRTHNAVLHTLIHEGEHGLQEVKGFSPCHMYSQNLQSTLMIRNLSEAAADVAAIDAAFQMGGEAWEEEKSNKGSRPGLAQTFEAAYNNTGNLNMARCACVKEWFSTSNGHFPKAYERSVVRTYEAALKNGFNFSDDTKCYSTKSLADFYLRKPTGKPLFDKPEVEFAHPIYSGITNDTRTAMNRLYAERKRKLGIEPDPSLVLIPEKPEKKPVAIQKNKPLHMPEHHLAAQISGRD